MMKVATSLTVFAACAAGAFGCSDRGLGDARPTPATEDAAPAVPPPAPSTMPPPAPAPAPDAGVAPPPDANIARDAAADRPGSVGDAFVLPDVPILGDDGFVPGGGCADSCTGLLGEYWQALRRAQQCTPGQVGQCHLGARSSLSCDSSPAWVTNDSEISPLAARFRRECSGCFFRSDVGERQDSCKPPLPGYELAVPKCVPQGFLPGSVCINYDPRRDCTPDIMPGLSCAPADNWCRLTSAPGVGCSCIGNPLRWSCSASPPPAGGP